MYKALSKIWKKVSMKYDKVKIKTSPDDRKFFKFLAWIGINYKPFAKKSAVSLVDQELNLPQSLTIEKTKHELLCIDHHLFTCDIRTALDFDQTNHQNLQSSMASSNKLSLYPN